VEDPLAGDRPALSFWAVASGFSQYPAITVAPRITSWPTWSGPTRFPASSITHASVSGIGMPTLVGLRSRSSGGRYVQRLHSVRPYIE